MSVTPPVSIALAVRDFRYSSTSGGTVSPRALRSSASNRAITDADLLEERDVGPEARPGRRCWSRARTCGRAARTPGGTARRGSARRPRPGCRGWPGRAGSCTAPRTAFRYAFGPLAARRVAPVVAGEDLVADHGQQVLDLGDRVVDVAAHAAWCSGRGRCTRPGPRTGSRSAGRTRRAGRPACCGTSG